MSRPFELARDFVDSLKLRTNRFGASTWIQDRDDAIARLAVLLESHFSMKNLWLPIDALTDRYAENLLLRAPELYTDGNEHGIARGFWRDGDADGDTTQNGGAWMAAGYDLNDDCFVSIEVTPTHFMICEGPAPFTEEELCRY